MSQNKFYRSHLEGGIEYALRTAESGISSSPTQSGEYALQWLLQTKAFMQKTLDRSTLETIARTEERMKRKATVEEIRLILGRDYL